jgi:hypothetical protein
MAAGFVDTMIYEMEAGDPTMDEMMVFYKPPFAFSNYHGTAQPALDFSKEGDLSQRCQNPLTSELKSDLPKKLQSFLDSIPVGVLAMCKEILNTVANNVPSLSASLSAQIAHLPTAQRLLASLVADFVFPMLSQAATKTLRVLEVRPFFQKETVTSNN